MNQAGELGHPVPAGAPDAGLVLAVDGGNSKTDLALVRADGALLAFVRGPLGSPFHLGFDGTVELLGGMLAEAVAQAGLDTRGGRSGGGPIASVGHLMLAGIDFPSEEQALLELVRPLGWARRLSVRNDTFAVLRAGTARGWGVAVTCGSGINCVGVAPDGREVRFPSLGAITGDWGGGKDVGIAALGAAARSEDGRGPITSLQRSVPTHFGLATAAEVAEAIHLGTIPMSRLAELSPVVFAEADHDPVAGGIVERVGAEIVSFVRAALERLDVTSASPEVVLGGGLIQAADGRLVDAARAGLADLGPDLVVRAASSPPIVGAALLGLDDLGADEDAKTRLRGELGDTVTGMTAPR
jgi:N-acetylglucosamine kinase-like BadF-type ATPase